MCVQRRARSLMPWAFFLVGSIMFQMQWNAALPAQKAETNYYFAGMTTVRRPSPPAQPLSAAAAAATSRPVRRSEMRGCGDAVC